MDEIANQDGRSAPLLAAAIGIILVIALAIIDVYYGVKVNTSSLFPTLLLVCWWARDRRFLWLFTALCIAAVIAAGVLEQSDSRAWLHRCMAIAALLAMAGITHYLLFSWQIIGDKNDQLKSRSDDLARANADLEARETEIATQNEELRSTTEELERQSEELRVANDELARRERTLESLLRLARSLSADQSRSETMERICRSLAEMIDGPGLGVAIKLFEEGVLRIVCHHGFGDAGLASDVLPFEQSFARLIIEKNYTGYLEDINLRPDLVIPQPKEGDRFRSVVAAPLRVNGKAIGTLEVLSRDPRTWSDEQVAMLESLASQTSISLQSAEFFERVEQQRRRFETIFHTLPIGVSVIDAASRQLISNPAGVSLLNLPAQIEPENYPASISFRRFRDGVELSFQEMPLMRALGGEAVRGEEVEMVFPDGRRITVLISAAPIRTPRRIEGAVSVYADITTLKALHQELDARRRSAEESSLRKTRFLAQVSHDIRNPVNAISLLAELLYRTASEPAMAAEVPSIAADVRRNALSLVELVTVVLDLTRFDSGRIDLEESEFSLNELINDECR
ncbi:MAG TPA: histidine kinase dimerization/phospho-acceptor domain-containing protein, partial [Tepidisphaeraceae bacterium]